VSEGAYRLSKVMGMVIMMMVVVVTRITISCRVVRYTHDSRHSHSKRKLSERKHDQVCADLYAVERIHCCHAVVTLLLHCCYTVVALVLHCADLYAVERVHYALLC
jgi:hypothetical protein